MRILGYAILGVAFLYLIRTKPIPSGGNPQGNLYGDTPLNKVQIPIASTQGGTTSPAGAGSGNNVYPSVYLQAPANIVPVSNALIFDPMTGTYKIFALPNPPIIAYDPALPWSATPGPNVAGDNPLVTN